MPLYTTTVPMFLQSLANLVKIIERAEKHAKAEKFDSSVYLTYRLAPDMFNFTQQVQYAYFLALDVTSKLSGKKEPVFTYDEKSLAELKESIRRTIKYLKSVKPKDFSEAEKKLVPVFWNPKQRLTGADYVAQLGIPDFFFHYAIAYGILRHGGVPLGKEDYIGRLRIAKGRK
jgi:hypothetical protein